MLARWLLLALTLLAACQPVGDETPPSSADLAIVNATVWTGDPARPSAEAVLIGDGLILDVGTSADVLSRAGDAEVVDAAGRFVTPGFIDAHVHFLDGGFKLASVQLRDADSPEEFARRIGAFAETVPEGTWITGGDWDHQLWGGELPHRGMIDELTPNHPVWVNRLDGHMALANSLALEAAGVTRATEEVPGGTIERDATGEPTGVLKDNAMVLVDEVVPPPTDDAYDRALAAAMSHVTAQGVTTVHHMGSWNDLEVFRRARERDALETRIYAAVPLSSWKRLRDFVETEGRGDVMLSFGGLKGFVDGSLGSHTAAFDEPYDDLPDDRGLLVNTEDELYDWISSADAADLHVMVHAIGDRANHILLDIYERISKENGDRDRRFRIEHAQHLRPKDIPRFAELDVIPSMQPYHAIDDGRWAERYIGPRIGTTYAFRSLLEAGARLTFGSDWTVAPATPLEGIYAAVTRRTLDGANPEGWVPEEKISVEEALVAYTRNGAFASFEEEIKGMVKVGYVADLAVIDRDLLSIPPEEIRDARVVMTLVDGRIVYEDEGPAP